MRAKKVARDISMIREDRLDSRGQLLLGGYNDNGSAAHARILRHEDSDHRELSLCIGAAAPLV